MTAVRTDMCITASIMLVRRTRRRLRRLTRPRLAPVSADRDQVNPSMRNQRTGGIMLPVRAFCRRNAIAAAITLTLVPASQVAPSAAYAEGAASVVVRADTSVEDFYRARSGA